VFVDIRARLDVREGPNHKAVLGLVVVRKAANRICGRRCGVSLKSLSNGMMAELWSESDSLAEWLSHPESGYGGQLCTLKAAAELK
jgi:hypothetical protein